jgi:ribosome-associated protein
MNPKQPELLEAEDDAGPSKSQRKRDMHALQTLGEDLAAQSVERLRGLALPDKLLEALLQVKGFKAHGAVRRQMQYIGKLMREIDPEPLRARLDEWNGVSREAVVRQHLAEHWRERLLDSDEVMGELLADFPAVDIPTLRTLVRNARRERGEQKPPRNFRELYRLLLVLIEDGGGRPAAADSE